MTSARTGPGVATRQSAPVLWGLRIVGAVLLAVMGWIHLDLWLTGYRTIAVIGPAFLLNVLAGFGLAVLLLITPRRFLPWVAGLGALTALGTLGGLLCSTFLGLFGFKETTAAGLWWESCWVEIATVVVLAVLAVLGSRRPARHRHTA
jgi:hypothetical protein